VHPYLITRALLLPLLFVIGAIPAYAQVNTSLECIAAPALPPPGDSVRVTTVQELQSVVNSLQDNTTIVLAPGTYNLTYTISIEADNVTMRGELDDCDSVQLVGPGMRNPEFGSARHGIWINAKNTLIANLTVAEYYFHSIAIDGNAQSPHIYNVRMINPGTQFVKANPVAFGDGADNGIVEYSIMAFTDGPPAVDRNNGGTGYTNGVDVHAGADWRISNNRFSNFHTPDTADNLVNPAVLIWNGAKGTITENNTFINVDRAIAYGLVNRPNDHQGGVIRNNMIVQEPGLFSAERKTKSDASIIVWSPDTRVLHNTILNNGNAPNAIDLRWDGGTTEVSNNLTDAPIRHRDRSPYTSNNNVTYAREGWFVDPVNGNLRLRYGRNATLKKAERHELAQYDIDGVLRPTDNNVIIGASEKSEIPFGNANSINSDTDEGGGTFTASNLAWLLLGAIIYLRSRFI